MYKTHITLPEALLALNCCQTKTSFELDHTRIAYAIARRELHEEDTRPSDSTLGGVHVWTSLELNKSASQPLSLSLVDEVRPDLPSWSPDWSTYFKRFLLNHPASTFQASRHPFRDGKSELPMKCKWMGFMADTIRDTSDYLPPRRHCDHYAVSGGNSTLFSQWFKFAYESLNVAQTEDKFLLDYADTIQARGCGHIWEPLKTDNTSRLREIRAFLTFLEVPGTKETNNIRCFYAACYPSHDRKFAITRSRRLCLVPEATRRGDLVCVLHGSRVPHILRLLPDGISYVNIGEAYVQDLMRGEVGDDNELEERVFYIS